MRSSCLGFLVVGALLTSLATVATADDAQHKAIEKDRKLIEGTWRIAVLQVNGEEAKQEDAKKLKVVNGSDGTWSLRSEGNEIGKGTSTIDPTKKPKTIDFTATEATGVTNQYLGIYELGKESRRLCFAQPGKERPTEFASPPGSEIILVTFEREKTK